MIRGIREETVMPASTPLPRAAAPIIPAIEESSGSTHLTEGVIELEKTTFLFAAYLGQYMRASDAVYPPVRAKSPAPSQKSPSQWKRTGQSLSTPAGR